MSLGADRVFNRQAYTFFPFSLMLPEKKEKEKKAKVHETYTVIACKHSQIGQAETSDDEKGSCRQRRDLINHREQIQAFVLSSYENPVSYIEPTVSYLWSDQIVIFNENFFPNILPRIYLRSYFESRNHIERFQIIYRLWFHHNFTRL